MPCALTNSSLAATPGVSSTRFYRTRYLVRVNYCRDEGKLTTRSLNSPFALSSLVSVSRIIFSDSSIIRFYVCNRHQSSRIKRQIVKIYHILDIPFFCTISDKSSQFPSQIYNFFAIERHLLVIPSPKCQSSHIRLIVVCPLTVGQHQPWSLAVSEL